MNPSELRGIQAFEDGLKPGDPVVANWTNSGCAYGARAEVVRRNAKSVRVRLVEATGSYAAGREIVCPRLAFGSIDRWSANNRVEPVPVRGTLVVTNPAGTTAVRHWEQCHFKVEEGAGPCELLRYPGFVVVAADGRWFKAEDVRIDIQDEAAA